MSSPVVPSACLATAVALLAAIGPAAAQPAGITVCVDAALCAWLSWPALAALAAPGAGVAGSTPVPLALSAIPGEDGVAIRPVLFLLGIVYKDDYFEGESLAFYDQGGCHLGSLPLFDMPAAFDNAVSSVDSGYSGCNVAAPYDLPGGAGASTTCEPDCPVMPDDMDDRTSSIQFRFQ